MKRILMLKYFFLYALLILISVAHAQPKPKSKEKPSSEMDKAMEDAMKGMSEEDKAEMRKMMKDVMPEMEKKPASVVAPFSDNKRLVPMKDAVRIARISKKVFTDAELSANTSLLYSKLIAKIQPAEKKIITDVSSKAKSGAAFMDAALTSFLQGHDQAAMALAMKAVQADPKNVNYQNNLAAMLSQSGYPEQAIPYLKKLSKQFPTNGTLQHNLGYAWLALGEIDTAARFFAYAAVNNPANAETMLCKGLVEELRGDPKKAADHYAESFEHAPNPFTETLAKNVQAEGRLEKIDFEKLKSRIAIHEYFKKDWIAIPVLVDSVDAYEHNMRLINGYQKMFEELINKIDTMLEASGAEVQALAEKDESTFIREMAKETIKGYNVMSMPAVYIQKILMIHMNKWNQEYATEHQALLDKVRAQKEVMTKSGNKDKCPDFNRKNDQFMSYANPLIRKFHAKKIDEFRVWINAYCTWAWYIAGNPKNTVLTQCLGWTSFLARMYRSALEDQYAFSKSCVKQDGDGVANIAAPAIPNFTCPTVVNFPVGINALRLSSETTSFDDNQWNIKHDNGTGMHNATVSFGIDKSQIAEPGKYGNPYIKSGNGSVNTSGIHYAEYNDQELTPLSKILDELTPLPKLPLDELAPLNPAMLKGKKLGKTDLENLMSADIARKILREMMGTKCPGKLPPKKPVNKKRLEVTIGEIIFEDAPPEPSKFEVGIGEIIFEDAPPEKKTFELTIGEIIFEDVIEVGLGDQEWWEPDMQAWVNQTTGAKRYEEGFKQKLVSDVRDALTTSGLQVSISNGLEGLRNMNNVDRGLFDK